LLILALVPASALIPVVDHQPDLIAMELIRATDMQQNASFDCWIDAVKNLESNSMSLPAHNTQLSAGTKVCSVLAKNQQKAFALELTKCHLKDSRRSPIPDTCLVDGIASGINERGIRQCLSDLSQEGFIVYSQFFLFTEQTCTKLTGELLIHRKNEAVNRFEESARMINDKIQETLQIQEDIIHGMSEQNEYLSQQREVSMNVQAEMGQVMKGMMSQREFFNEHQHAVSAVKEVSCCQGYSGKKQ